jgi:hypothetical protein
MLCACTDTTLLIAVLFALLEASVTVDWKPSVAGRSRRMFRKDIRYGLCPPLTFEHDVRQIVLSSAAALEKKIIIEMIQADAPWALVENDGNFSEIKNPLHELEELRRKFSKENVLRMNIRNIAKENRELRRRVAELEGNK